MTIHAPESPIRYVSAARYLEIAGISLTGRSLRRWCAKNRHLGEALGEIRAEGKCLYDATTAPEFRRLWMEAERKYHDETDRLEQDADRRFGRDGDAK